MNRSIHVLVLALASNVAWSAPAHGQASSDSQGETAEVKAPPRDPVEDIVEKLLTAEDDGDDLRWLYSNSDEYTPSELTGKPIPTPGLPQRGEGSPRFWDPRWRKFGTANYVLASAGLLAGVAASFIPNTPDRWRKRNGFDEWGRRNFGIVTYDDALWARDLSDLLVSVNIAFPFLVDSLIVTSWYRRSNDVASQMALISAETMAVIIGIQTVVSGVVSRERPLVRDCGYSIDAKSEDCTDKDRYRSFFSGHTSNAFAAASLTCGNHLRHDLFGDPISDALTCGVAMASAATVGTMRVVGGRHYLSDVIAGATMGTAVGFGLPWALHYGAFGKSNAPSASLHLVPLPNWISVGGAF